MGRSVAPGALYTTLERVEQKGWVASRVGEPTAARGGRAKRFYTVTAFGKSAVREAQLAFHRLSEGLDLQEAQHA